MLDPSEAGSPKLSTTRKDYHPLEWMCYQESPPCLSGSIRTGRNPSFQTIGRTLQFEFRLPGLPDSEETIRYPVYVRWFINYNNDYARMKYPDVFGFLLAKLNAGAGK